MMLATLPRWLSPAPDSQLACSMRRGRAPWVEFIHLAWSVWVFMVPLFSPDGYDRRWLLLTLASYPVFVLLYTLCLTAPRRRAHWFALGMVALAMVLAPVYPACMSYFVFGCIMLRIDRMRSLPAYLLQLLLLNAAFLGLVLWIGYPWQALAWLPVISVIVGVIVNVERSNDQKEHELRLSHDEVRRLAATAERERIGRDLHDLLGHTLSLITLKLELSRKLFERDPVASRRELEDAEGIARHALAEVRSAVTGIRAADLAAELASARLMLESTGVHLDYDPPPTGLPPDLERGLALVLREAATNIARHAHAGAARVGFARTDGRLQVQVSDDGVGGAGARPGGNGLRGMRERVAKLGGTLAIESPPRKGTRLQLQLPIGCSEAPRPASGIAATIPLETEEPHAP